MNKNTLTIIGETLTRIGETIDQHRADRAASAGEAAPQKPGRVRAFLRWLTPNGGTLLLIALLVLTQNVWAWRTQAPAAPGASATTVNYQGRLADSDGNPLDGVYGMTFALYDAPTGGNPIWTESHTAVTVSDGLFSVGLGSQTPGGIPTSVWDGDRYLEITVGGETLSPRELIRSVPIAGMALTVPDGSITTDKIDIDANLDLQGHSLTNIGSLQLPVQLNSDRPWEITYRGSGALTQTGIRTIVDYKDFVFWNQDDSEILSIRAMNGGGYLDMKGHPIKNIGAIVEANIQTEEEANGLTISRFSRGDLLCWDNGRLEKCSENASILVIAVADENGKPIVLGAEPVKVVGPVHPGDLLVSSDVPGYAIAWSQIGEGTPPVGVVIAKALETFDGGQGMIKAMIFGR